MGSLKLEFEPAAPGFAQLSVKIPEQWDEGSVSFIPVWYFSGKKTND